MKKLFFSLLASAFISTVHAQTVSLSVTTPPCHDDGVITATFSGLGSPLTVTWTTFGSSGTTVTHTGVTGTDALTSYSGGPVYVYASDGVTSSTNYFPGLPPFSYYVSTSPAICPALGSATVTVSGGTAPYTYQWTDAATSATVGTTSPISLPGGGYSLLITDAAGCTYGTYAVDSAIIIESIASFSVGVTTTSANCTNGTATSLLGAGAVMPVSYLWSSGATSSSISSLSTGMYNVAVTDALGCTANGYGIVTQAVTITAPITTTPATCITSDGAVIAFGSGGLPPYSYVWSNGATTASQTGLPEGYYGVTVTDANGCIGSNNTYLNSSTPITVTYSTTPSLCTSGTGTATLVASGGTAPYSVIWYTTPPQTTMTATALAAGNYNFKVTDAVGCVRTGTVTVPPVTIIGGSFSATPATCALSNGSMSITPSGGTAPYIYLWNTGATTSGITSKPAGYYTVNITDAAGCTSHLSHWLPLYSPMTTGTSTTPASCIFTSDGILNASASGGTSPYSFSWWGTATGSGSTLTGMPEGDYWLGISDAIGCSETRHVHLGYLPATSCYCTIEGTVYEDLNGNCTQDAGEMGIPHIQIHCSGRGYTYTDASGHYSFKVPTGSYTISQTILAFYPLSACQSNDIPVSVTASSGCVNTINFADAVSPIHDMRISTWNYNWPVPGNTYHQITLISNAGTVTESGVLASYQPDGQLFAPSFVPSGIFSGSPYWYNTSAGFPSLAPGATQHFHMSYSVPTSVPLGTSLWFKDSVAWHAPMSSWLTDYSPWNNTKYFTTTVLSSFDPNFKEVSPKGTGPTGLIHGTDSVLEYMVHFQNTGTYLATNIVVIDTLDNNLDWVSMRPVYESAPCQVTLDPQGPYKIAKFTFNNINLPAQLTDDLRSNGLFTYTVKLRHGLAAGTQIRNRASIYFDYNAPVLTNTTLNTLQDPTALNTVDNTGKCSFTVYPNPAQQTFYTCINSITNGIADMKICDVTGKTLINKTITVHKGAQTVSTGISQLSTGVYFVTLTQDGNVETQKLVIAK